MYADTLSNRLPLLSSEPVADAYHALTSYERAEADQDIVEGMVKAYETASRLLRQYVALPLVRLHLRNRLVEELSRLSDRSLTDIGMSRREIVAAARKAYPLFDKAAGKTVPALAGVRKVTSDARQMMPANDDSKRQAA